MVFLKKNGIFTEIFPKNDLKTSIYSILGVASVGTKHNLVTKQGIFPHTKFWIKFTEITPASKGKTDQELFFHRKKRGLS